MNVEWKEPPAATSLKWKPIIAACRANPGRWAFVGRTNYSSGYQYAKRHGLEVRIVNRDGTKADVYLRQTEGA